MYENTTLSWLDSLISQIESMLSGSRLGHALMLTGPVGVGKRALANWLSARYLLPGTPVGMPSHPWTRLTHPDSNWICPDEGKSRISVDQIRALVTDLSLKSHAGRGKSAVIEPADAMTLNAANSLLKTLEEPPGDTLLVLVTDSLSTVPATVLSRCAILRVRLPAPGEALDWLQRVRPDEDWSSLLALAGGAPLRALGLVERGASSLHDVFSTDLGKITSGAMSPLEAAGRWASKDAKFALAWLERLTGDLIRRRVAEHEAGPLTPVSESVLQRMDSRDLFCYLDRLTALRNQPDGSFNEQLALESLLIAWTAGLEDTSGGPETTPLGIPLPGGCPRHR